MIFLDFNDVKTLLELEKAESNYPVIGVIEESVIAAIENHVRRKLIYANYVDKEIIEEGSRIHALKAYPIKLINYVKIDGESITDYRQLTQAIDLRQPYSQCEIEVSYYGGYKKITDTGNEFTTVQNLDSEIYRAIFLQTIFEYQSRDYIGANTVTNEGGSVSKPGLKLLDEVVRILKNHRHVVSCGI